MADQLLRSLWNHATDWLLAIVMIAGIWIARGLVFAPAALPLVIPYAVPLSVGAADGGEPAPVPIPPVIRAVDNTRIVEVAGLAFAFAGLLARLWLKDRELKRRHADDLLTAYRELADLKHDAAKLEATVTALRAACPHQETCPVKLLDRLPILRPTITPTDPRPTKAEIDSDL